MGYRIRDPDTTCRDTEVPYRSVSLRGAQLAGGLPSLRALQEVEVGHIYGRADAGRLGSIFASLTDLTRLEIAFEWCAAEACFTALKARTSQACRCISVRQPTIT